MNTNPMRGEVIIEIDGIAYIMRPTFKALAVIEEQLSQSLIQLMQKIAEETITVRELAVIIEQSMENRASAHFIAEAIIRNGLGGAIDAVAKLFVLVFGGVDASAQ